MGKKATFRRQRLDDGEKTRMRAAKADGVSNRDLAKRFGVSAELVAKVLRESPPPTMIDMRGPEPVIL